jgi:hypothetical protein
VFRIVIVILINHRHKPIDLILSIVRPKVSCCDNYRALRHHVLFETSYYFYSSASIFQELRSYLKEKVAAPV